MHDPLRHVELYMGYQLKTFDTGRADRLCKSILAYEFTDASGKVIFQGEDFGCSPLHGIDSDETLRALLGFLTLKPGDTDADYFTEYTSEQMAFAQGDAEYLSMYALDDSEMEFKNLDGFAE